MAEIWDFLLLAPVSATDRKQIVKALPIDGIYAVEYSILRWRGPSFHQHSPCVPGWQWVGACYQHTCRADKEEQPGTADGHE